MQIDTEALLYVEYLCLSCVHQSLLMPSALHYHFHFYYNKSYNLIKIDTLVFLHIFFNRPYITCFSITTK